MEIILILFPILLIIYVLLILFNFLNAKKQPAETVVAYTGGLGTGKTLMAVKQATKEYKKKLLLWRLGLLSQVKKKRFWIIPDKKHKQPMPRFYSNIPVMLKRPFWMPKKYMPKKYYFSNTLMYEHIIMTERMEEYSTVLMDELGQIADQYQYDNPFVMQNIQDFIRFFRHFIDGRMFVTDQSSSNIVVAVRRRLNVIYNLHEFRRALIFFFRVNCSTVMISEDMLTVNEVSSQEEYEYFTGYLPFKWFKSFDISRIFSYKLYESRVYKPLYAHVQHRLPKDQWNDYFTSYLLDIPNQQEMKKKYKKFGYLSDEEMERYYIEYQKARGRDTGHEDHQQGSNSG